VFAGFEVTAGEPPLISLDVAAGGELATIDDGTGVGGVGWYCTLMSYYQGSSCTFSGPMELRFDTPVQRFGGYFGTWFGSSSNPFDPTIQFYDSSGALIADLPMNVPRDCQWVWQGWEVEGNSIERVVIHSGYSAGHYIALDELTASASPGMGCGGGSGCDLRPVLNAIALLEAKTDAIEAKTDAIEVKADMIEGKADALEAKVDRIDANVQAIQAELATLMQNMNAMYCNMARLVNTPQGQRCEADAVTTEVCGVGMSWNSESTGGSHPDPTVCPMP
jgi:hypothetical protein